MPHPDFPPQHAKIGCRGPRFVRQGSPGSSFLFALSLWILKVEKARWVGGLRTAFILYFYFTRFGNNSLPGSLEFFPFRMN